MITPRNPKKVQVNGEDFIIHKFFATDGEELMLHYALSLASKLSDMAKFFHARNLLMKYVAKPLSANSKDVIFLENDDLINNHVHSWETLSLLQFEVVRYNSDFFLPALSAKFSNEIAAIQEVFMSSTKQYPPSSVPSSEKEKTFTT